MYLSFFDTETTGLNTQEDEILELGYAIYHKDNPVPLLLKSSFIRNQKKEISKEITELTGITQETVDKFGLHPMDVYEEYIDDLNKYDVKYAVGHNSLNFDTPMITSNVSRFTTQRLPPLVTVDTMYDIKYRTKSKSLRLSYLLADHGFINPFPHRALTDAMGCAILAYQYDMDKMLEIASTPMVEIRADVGYDKRDLAKALQYQWDGDRKIWAKKIREFYLKEEIQRASFPVLVLQRVG